MGDQAVILVVDDHRNEREYYRKVLVWAGYTVVTAGDGTEALSVLKQRHIDLILADIRMPRLDGYELYLAVRTDVHLAMIPFLFVSAYARDSDVRAYGERLGAGQHLTKPIEPASLIAAIGQYLDHDRQDSDISPEREDLVGEAALCPPSGPRDVGD